jgi:hypothetical protein
VVGGAGETQAQEPAQAQAPAPARGKHRLGRGSTRGWAPAASYSTSIDDDLQDEVAAIEVALKEHGPLRRDVLKQRVNSRRWGPGCFARALQQATSAGIVTRTGRNQFALSGDGGTVPFASGDRAQTPSR